MPPSSAAEPVFSLSDASFTVSVVYLEGICTSGFKPRTRQEATERKLIEQSYPVPCGGGWALSPTRGRKPHNCRVWASEHSPVRTCYGLLHEAGCQCLTLHSVQGVPNVAIVMTGDHYHQHSVGACVRAFLGHIHAGPSVTGTRGSVYPALPKMVDLFIYENSWFITTVALYSADW
jgi:hypothetical protein